MDAAAWKVPETASTVIKTFIATCPPSVTGRRTRFVLHLLTTAVQVKGSVDTVSAYLSLLEACFANGGEAVKRAVFEHEAVRGLYWGKKGDLHRESGLYSVLRRSRLIRQYWRRW
jgi:hypothetical protein